MPSPHGTDPVVNEPASSVRAKFNAALVWERAQEGHIRMKVIADRHPSRPLARERHCTRSQMVAFVDPVAGWIAVAHLYRRTDGSLGASGRPDPKWFWDGASVLVAVP